MVGFKRILVLFEELCVLRSRYLVISFPQAIGFHLEALLLRGHFKLYRVVLIAIIVT